jgi:hypothetical protein
MLKVLKLRPKTGARTGARDEYFGSTKPKIGKINQGLEIPPAEKSRFRAAHHFLAYLSGFSRG